MSANFFAFNYRHRPRALWVRLFYWVFFVFISVSIVASITFALYVLHLNQIVTTQFEGKRWALPAHVYARPLELFTGKTLPKDRLKHELAVLNYREDNQLTNPGSWYQKDQTFFIYQRAFNFWDEAAPTQRIAVTLRSETNKVGEIYSLTQQKEISLTRLEPVHIDSIYPAHNEDRILVRLNQVPTVITDALMAVEDRDFYHHFGINLKSIARAFLVNWRAGRTVQGASTLTQQLVKNFFLTNQRTWRRKANEAIMALLLEYHYSKDEILEAYINEVYLGQNGPLAIHGFALASQFYFGRSLKQIDLPQIALLIGLVNGPSEFNPRRRPKAAKARRDLVLRAMAEQGLISQEDAKLAIATPLEVIVIPPRQNNLNYPGFMDLVRRQLREIYQSRDLSSDGLRIFTTLDTYAQHQAEQALVEQLHKIEQDHDQAKDLQAASVVINSQTGEVEALVAGREPRFAGFNRALNARRSIGSLIKPVVYATALAQPARYTLATLLDDSRKLVYRTPSGTVWNPQNDDRRYHGMVPLITALTKSYNVASARLGLDLGLSNVISSLQNYGLKPPIPRYPSLLLGAINLSPFQVASFYQTIASGGFRMPLRSVMAVAKPSGEQLEHEADAYSLEITQVISPDTHYLITYAMQQIPQSGTARSMPENLRDNYHPAGKTGTTNNYVDSWFAGFTGSHLTVVWVGRDDNRSIGLSGARGALPVWSATMERIATVPLKLSNLDNITDVLIDPKTNLLANDNCRRAVSLPFVEGSAPIYYSRCGARSEPTATSNESNTQNQPQRNATPPPTPSPQPKPVRPTIIESW